MQEPDKKIAEALSRGNLDDAALPSNERALLEFAARLTQKASSIESNEIEKLRQQGWKEPQIAEAVYIISLFAFFNRVADAFGLEEPQ